jgi:hypothetical protein
VPPGWVVLAGRDQLGLHLEEGVGVVEAQPDRFELTQLPLAKTERGNLFIKGIRLPGRQYSTPADAGQKWPAAVSMEL